MSTATANGTDILAINGGKPHVPEGTIKNWPPIDDIDRTMVMDSLNSANHAFGPNCVELQKGFAAWNGNKYAVTTNSGTAALHMGLAACGCGARDEVIVTSYSWSSSATCIMANNSIPVFVDINFDTITIDIEKIEAAITPKTKAIICVHLHGLPVEMEPILKIAKKHNLKVIEDACQAHGSLYKGKKTGTWGDCAAFSFNQNKCMCSGEGGMFVTDNEEMLKKAQALWSFGETATPQESRDYHVYAMGWMYRNNDLTAAFGRAQLSKLDGYLAQTRENARVLHDNLQWIPGLILPTVPEDCDPNWYNYVIRLDMEALGVKGNASDFRDKVVKAMNAEGVPATVWQKFILPAMTVFQAKNGYGQGCPWECQHAQPVSYALDQYPMAQEHTDTHFCIIMPLRAPNGPEVAELVAEGIRKVMKNVDQI
jgi:dTDP-4-amino-4,6-dideoxygalactose transaminase